VIFEGVKSRGNTHQQQQRQQRQKPEVVVAPARIAIMRNDDTLLRRRRRRRARNIQLFGGNGNGRPAIEVFASNLLTTPSCRHRFRALSLRARSFA